MQQNIRRCWCALASAAKVATAQKGTNRRAPSRITFWRRRQGQHRGEEGAVCRPPYMYPAPALGAHSAGSLRHRCASSSGSEKMGAQGQRPSGCSPSYLATFSDLLSAVSCWAFVNCLAAAGELGSRRSHVLNGLAVCCVGCWFRHCVTVDGQTRIFLSRRPARTRPSDDLSDMISCVICYRISSRLHINGPGCPQRQALLVSACTKALVLRGII